MFNPVAIIQMYLKPILTYMNDGIIHNVTVSLPRRPVMLRATCNLIMTEKTYLNKNPVFLNV